MNNETLSPLFLYSPCIFLYYTPGSQTLRLLLSKDNTMHSFHASSKRTLLLVAVLHLLLPVSATHGQQPQQRSSNQADDVIRIKTELVQTDLMVFDKQGRFVDGLKPEQFELLLDGKPQPISFFERVATGSAA